MAKRQAFDKRGGTDAAPQGHAPLANVGMNHAKAYAMTYAETWKAIASMTQRSERWCRYMAKAQPHPLPVYKVGGIVRLDQTDYLQWIGRQKHTFVAGSAPMMAA